MHLATGRSNCIECNASMSRCLCVVGDVKTRGHVAFNEYLYHGILRSLVLV